MEQMKELEKTYNPADIEDRLYRKWEDKKYFHAEVDRSKKPFTIVMPPPNVTGQLHMGHALDNTMQDILIRFKRMQGYSGHLHRRWQKNLPLKMIWCFYADIMRVSMNVCWS